MTLENKILKEPQKQLLLYYSQRKYRMTTEPLLLGASNFVWPYTPSNAVKNCSPPWLEVRQENTAWSTGFSCTNAFLIHIAYSSDHQRFVYTVFLIHCCQPEWDKSWRKAASLTGVLWKVSVHVRGLMQAGIDVISLSDSWSNAHLSKITASHSCCLEDNLQCNALEMWFCLRYIREFFVCFYSVNKETLAEN